MATAMRSVARNTTNQGVARFGPSARSAYAGPRNAQTRPGVFVTPPAKTVARRTNGAPTESRAMTYRSKRFVRARIRRLPALQSDSPSASAQPTRDAGAASGRVSGAKMVTYPATTPARFRRRASSSSSGWSAIEISRTPSHPGARLDATGADRIDECRVVALVLVRVAFAELHESLIECRTRTDVTAQDDRVA